MQGRRREIIVYEIPKSDIQKLDRCERTPASIDSPSSLYVCWWKWSCYVVGQSKCWVHMTEWSLDFILRSKEFTVLRLQICLFATRIFYVDTLIVNVYMVCWYIGVRNAPFNEWSILVYSMGCTTFIVFTPRFIDLYRCYQLNIFVSTPYSI